MINRLIGREDLSFPEARELMEGFISGAYPPVQVGAILTALRMKGETIDELHAFARVMRDHCTPLSLSVREPLLDTCGTGGDGWGTFNISTTVAFVAAACGVKVVKHGNRAASSKCGSADVLEALGINLSHPPDLLGRQLHETGFCFLYARAHHPAMAALAPVRRQLGFRTMFNLLGPLTNPAGATHQVVGLYDPLMVEKIAHVLLKLGVRRALVVHGDGTDEFTTTGTSHYAELRDGAIRLHTLKPGDFGIPMAARKDLAGGDAGKNAAILAGILEGEKGPGRDIVLLNAGAALYVGEKASSIGEGIAVAREALESGKARKKVREIIEWRAL